MAVYDFVISRASQIFGVGAEAYAFRGSGQLVYGAFDERNTVRGQLDPQTPGKILTMQSGAMQTSLAANGISLQGQLALQALADLQGASK